MSKNRREELDNPQIYTKYRSKIKDIQLMSNTQYAIFEENADLIYGDLPF